MRKLTHSDFVSRATTVHQGAYSYPEPYMGSGIPLQIVCPTHGLFTQTPNAHISQQQGCPKCALEVQASRQQIDSGELQRRLDLVHGGHYTYDLSHYKNMHTDMVIGCPFHGAFTQSMHSHLKGQGCPVCAIPKQQARNSRRTTALAAEFTKIASARHGGLFDYTGVVYSHNQQKITFRCIQHNQVVTQTARDHLDGYNPCTKCNHMKSSGETQVAQFMANLTTVVQRDRTLIKPKELDIYLPEKQLAIEYCGMYWHSHFNAEDTRKDRLKHYDKYMACQAQGVRLLTIYESEWQARAPAIRRLLRNAVGKGRGKLMARKCALQKVANADAKVFYEKYHPQGGAGSGEHYGLFWGGKLVACMRFVFGANDRGTGAANRAWTLGRYATRITVAGAASRLFAAFVAEFQPTVVKSFSDNRYFSGGMYEQLGFTLEESVGPDYQVWSPKLGLLPKTHYQRRQLPKRIAEHGVNTKYDPATDPRSEADVTYLMGCGRIYDCGKKRWVWTAPRVV